MSLDRFMYFNAHRLSEYEILEVNAMSKYQKTNWLDARKAAVSHEQQKELQCIQKEIKSLHSECTGLMEDVKQAVINNRVFAKRMWQTYQETKDINTVIKSLEAYEQQIKDMGIQAHVKSELQKFIQYVQSINTTK